MLDQYTLGCTVHKRTWGECQSERIGFLNLQVSELQRNLKLYKDCHGTACDQLDVVKKLHEDANRQVDGLRKTIYNIARFYIGEERSDPKAHATVYRILCEAIKEIEDEEGEVEVDECTCTTAPCHCGTHPRQSQKRI